MRKIYIYFVKTLICIILFLGLGIVCKLDIRCKDYIHKKLYEDYFDFSGVRLFYNQYLGGVFPIDNVSFHGLVSVFHEDLHYLKSEDYEEGVSLSVDYNYLVPATDKGIVVYVGEKDKYGNVVIVEGDTGVDIWYGNLCNIMVNLYDSVDSGSYLGESCNNKIYLVYTKKNEFLDYHDYLN